jgi:hypothetical protein
VGSGSSDSIDVISIISTATGGESSGRSIGIASATFIASANGNGGSNSII